VITVAKSGRSRKNIVMKSLLKTHLVLLSFLLSACAPELGLRLGAPTVPESTAISQSPSGAEQLRVRVGSFKDSRPSQTFVMIDGRKVGTEGSVAQSVEEGFARYLRQAGARIAVLNAPSIEGEVIDWTAKVDPAFPSAEAKASARIKVTVRDSKAHPLYHGTYSGEATRSHPMVDSEVVQNVLAQAMGSALEAAVNDEQFVAQLAKGRID
jgi:hypothetical protein